MMEPQIGSYVTISPHIENLGFCAVTRDRERVLLCDSARELAIGVIQIAENTATGDTGFNTTARFALAFEGLRRAEFAFLNGAGCFVVYANAVWACRHAVTASYAFLLIHTNDSVLVGVGGLCRADAYARSVFAMHALQRNHFITDMGEGSGFPLLVADVVDIGIEAVLPLAGSPTGIAAYAVFSIYQHSIARHYAPTFLIFTRTSCDIVPP